MTDIYVYLDYCAPEFKQHNHSGFVYVSILLENHEDPRTGIKFAQSHSHVAMSHINRTFFLLNACSYSYD